jgi:hypothetical protein
MLHINLYIILFFIFDSITILEFSGLLLIVMFMMLSFIFLSVVRKSRLL